MNIRDYVQNNYDKIKNILRKEFKKCYPQNDFDEDLFHDTILKSIYSLDNKEIDEGVISYLITAYKTNYIRQQNYSYNKYKTECEDMNEFDKEVYEFSSNIDVQNFIKEIKKNFGTQYTNYFIQWCKGYTIKEIQDKYGINDLYYKFKLIKNFIKYYLENNK